MLWDILQILFRTRHSFLQLPEVLASNGSQLTPRGIFLLPSKRTAFTKIIRPPTASSYLTADNCGSTKARHSFLDFGHLMRILIPSHSSTNFLHKTLYLRVYFSPTNWPKARLPNSEDVKRRIQHRYD